MKLFFLTILATASTLLPTVGQTAQPPSGSVLFQPFHVPAGKVLVTRSTSDASGGQISVIHGSSVQKGTLSIKRSRMYERRILGAGLTAKLEYNILGDNIHRSTTMGGATDTEDYKGALLGHVVYGILDDMGRWRLFLKGGTATNRQARELIEIESYENRQWYQKTPVKIGDSWSINPQFIRNFIERDMGPTTIQAKMTFKSVEVIDGERTAVLEFDIHSQARKKSANNAQTSSVTVNLKGTLYVALDTMLDKKLTLVGTLHTTLRQNGVTTLTKSPVTYIVTKSLR